MAMTLVIIVTVSVSMTFCTVKLCDLHFLLIVNLIVTSCVVFHGITVLQDSPVHFLSHLPCRMCETEWYKGRYVSSYCWCFGHTLYTGLDMPFQFHKMSNVWVTAYRHVTTLSHSKNHMGGCISSLIGTALSNLNVLALTTAKNDTYYLVGYLFPWARKLTCTQSSVGYYPLPLSLSFSLLSPYSPQTAEEALTEVEVCQQRRFLFMFERQLFPNMGNHMLSLCSRVFLHMCRKNWRH